MAEQQNKRITGELGEMYVALKLHNEGWQVYRPIIDEQIDLIVTKYYCKKCGQYSALEKRKKGKSGEFPTNRCQECKKEKLILITRFLQVKASAGEQKAQDKAIWDYSFHAKLRHNVDPRSYYIWVPLIKVETTCQQARTLPTDYDPLFYIFHHSEINKFDNINLPCYQKTDNQKTTLKVNTLTKTVVNKGTKYDYSCFERNFRDNFGKLEKICRQDFA